MTHRRSSLNVVQKKIEVRTTASVGVPYASPAQARSRPLLSVEQPSLGQLSPITKGTYARKTRISAWGGVPRWQPCFSSAHRCPPSCHRRASPTLASMFCSRSHSAPFRLTSMDTSPKILAASFMTACGLAKTPKSPIIMAFAAR